ncbi:MAG: dihydropteroate synthase [Lentisphaeria bacterium]|nr:dihydropteroate synthase [Lentisphaeria bacterium]
MSRSDRFFETLKQPMRPGKQSRPRLFGILNLTPDSFSDGGAHTASPEESAEFAAQMVADGADALDLGAESTRPGSGAVPADEEINRLLPALKLIRARFPDLFLSVDTRKADVADAALAAGADCVNDVSGLQFDPRMADAVAKHHAALIIMHMRGTPETMQAPENLVYIDLIADVSAFLRDTASKAVRAGVDPAHIMLDPGVGFSKTDEQNMALIHRAAEFRKLGFPLFYGISRKGFIGRMYGIPCPADRDEATAQLQLEICRAGVEALRVHNVAVTLRAITAAGF